MPKILSAQQIKELDAYTIQHEPIASIDLMERACRAFESWFIGRFDFTYRVGIVCGTGNNGGDGLGIARLLSETGYNVQVWIVKGDATESIDFKINQDRIRKKIAMAEITPQCDQKIFSSCDILIDAIFGSGLSRPSEGLYSKVIECMNQTDALRIAIDVPSGLMMDKPSSGSIVKAHHTVSFQLPKLAFLLPQSYPFVGNWNVVPIGLNKDFIKQAASDYHYLSLKAIKRIVKPRLTFDHKGRYGHALIIAGSFGKIGAAILASRASLRTGLGLLTVHTPQCGNIIMQTAVPEAMVDTDRSEYFLTSVESTSQYSAIGVGPGLGQQPESVQAFASVLKQFKLPMVIDADALNILATNKELMKNIPPGSILTPHPKEFERLVGSWKNDFERLEKQRQLAKQLKCIIVLKGAYSSIASFEGNVYFNSTGNPGMATGGSGDVLTGILTSLLAQQYSPLEAAQLGVYLHGLSGDMVSYEKGMNSLIASDIIDFLPNAFKKITS
jgi:ADP-dependent NAD(P)H-hydrate dehydratase / NAD(P)H-hydrate epimerase